jgi:hypothetical protein
MNAGRIRHRDLSGRALNRSFSWGCFLFLVPWAAEGAGSVTPNERELVALYCKTAENWPFQKDKWILQAYEEDSVEGLLRKDIANKSVRDYTVYRDRDRFDRRHTLRRVWAEQEISDSVPEKLQWVILGERRYSYDNYVPEGRQVREVIASTGDFSQYQLHCAGATVASMEGHTDGELKPLSAILREESSELRMRASMEVANGFATYVLEVSTPYGRYTLWLDPTCAYCPRRISVQRGAADLFDGRPISSFRSSSRPAVAGPTTRPFDPAASYKEIDFVMDVLKVENITGTYVPAEVTTLRTITYSDGSVMRFHSLCKRPFMDLAPDFNSIPDAFILDVPDGTPVRDLDFPAARFEWRGGKVVTVVDPQYLEAIDDAAAAIKNRQLPVQAQTSQQREATLPPSPSSGGGTPSMDDPHQGNPSWSVWYFAGLGVLCAIAGIYFLLRRTKGNRPARETKLRGRAL